MSSISTTYALRSLTRHARRTLLSVIGIGIGTAIGVFLIAWVQGKNLLVMEAAAASGSGHLAITPPAWGDTRSSDQRLTELPVLLDSVRSHPNVQLAMPHASAEALLAFGNRVAGVQMRGVDPPAEVLGNRMVRTMSHGRYLEPGELGSTVIGSTIAERLKVSIGDDLLVTVADKDGEIAGAMLHIVGIAATGSRDIDATICQVDLAMLQQLTKRQGATNIALLLHRPKGFAATREELARAIGSRADVLTWRKLHPDLAASNQVDLIWTRLIVGIIMAVVFLGIASAQLAAVLERRKEFAVLSSLGMPASRLIRIMIAESIILGLAGAVLGLAIGLPIVWYTATTGVDFSEMMGDGDFNMSNVLIDPIIYSDFGWWLVPLALGLSLGATLLSSFYPAWFATRTDPATALRVDY